MTLIIYCKCLDATVILTDKKQNDEISNQTQSVRKYFLPTHQEYVLSLSGYGTRVDTITAPLEIEQTTADEIKKKIHDIVEIPKEPNFGDSDGFLLIIKNKPFEFYHIWTRTNKVGINHDNPKFECYGDGATLAKYFLHKFDLSDLPWNIALQYLSGIMQEVAGHNDSVGDIEKYGFDVVVIFDDGEIKQGILDKNLKIKILDFDFTPDESLKFDFISKKAIHKKLSKPTVIEKKIDEKPAGRLTGTIISDTKGLFAEPKERPTKNIDQKKTSQLIQAPSGANTIIVQTDRSVYLYNDTMIVTIIRPFSKDKSPITLRIVNKNNKIIYVSQIPIESGKNGIYQDVISIKGKGWDVRGEEYKVIAQHGSKTAEVSIWRSDFGATIELDQKVYTWTDKVFITVVAPDYTLDSKIPSSIGQQPDQKITISTGKGEIHNYKLAETGKNTGIFTGEVCLTGFKGYLKKDLKNKMEGIIQGSNSGPTDGLIACSNDDYITVTFTTRYDTVIGSALIRWNIGEVGWLEPSYPKNSIGKVRVIDPDMNVNPNEIDKFKIQVWSDSNPKGVLVTVTEAGEATGIFEGIVKFVNKLKAGKDLYVQDGDTVIAEYIDYTLPDPYTTKDELKITASTVIGTIAAPLEKILIKNHKIVDEDNKSMKVLHVKQKARIKADIFNQQQKSQPFVFVAQIQDESGIVIHEPAVTGSLSNLKDAIIELPWTPLNSGEFTISLFVWESLNNPTALTPTVHWKIQVKRAEQKVSVPIGTSVPGCEEKNRCFIPSELTIKKGQSVIWSNDDTAAHTITSGTPAGGPDGLFDSSLFMSGKTFTHFFSKKGGYPYFCMVHTWQTGIVVVK